MDITRKFAFSTYRWLSILFFIFGEINLVYANDFIFPITFDFGTGKSPIKESAIQITENMLYQPEKGYGLIKPVDGSFQLSNAVLKDEMIFDGIQSDKAISFQVDLPAGSYWIEIFMAGGTRSLWHGEIRANQKILVDSIFQYGVSFEDEEPPAYWSVMRKVALDTSGLQLSIKAVSQMTTITGIVIYQDEIGPIRLENDQLIALKTLKVPNGNLILRLLNQGTPEEALRLIDQIPANDQFRYEKALLLIALAGRLETAEPRVYIELAEKLLREELINNKRPDIFLNLRLAELYINGDMMYKMGGWDWAQEYTGAGIFSRLNMAGHEFTKITEIEIHPLYHRSLFYLGKLSFWAWVEQHDKWQKVRADRCFELLKPFYPNHRLLNIYRGDQFLPVDFDTTSLIPGVPTWVQQTQLAMTSLRNVIHYWVDNRQAENGEFGGKYDDDVEMLRWWPVARLAWNDSKTLTGLRRLVDGIWQSKWITNGFSTKVRDVEHAAEPVADTQPMMIGLDYGNPIYVERCMESMKGLSLWTGINEKGHRHFKSSWYSYNQVDSRPPRDCDVEMNTRTVKIVRWLAWYNRHPVAMKFLKEWTDAWLEDCQRTDKGKPYGIVPAAIRYHDDAIGGHADNWHHPGMFWRYYDFHGGISMMNHFLAIYDLTGDEKYLEPIEAALNMVTKYEKQNLEKAEVGSEAWVAAILQKSSGFAEVIELWRIMTGKSEFDEMISRTGSNYLKFLLTNNKNFLAEGSTAVVNGVQFNRELITTEGYFTDRIEIGNVNQSEVLGANHLESIYTGRMLNENFYPFYAVSWDSMDNDFVAVVLHSGKKGCQILVYNLTDKLKAGRINFWTLSPGTYQFRQGNDLDDDGQIDEVLLQDKFQVVHYAASHAISLPSSSHQLIEVIQIKANSSGPSAQLPDIAITDQDIEIKKIKESGMIRLSVPVHNIGIAPARNISVQLQTNINGTNVTLEEQKIKILDAPLDLNPKIKRIEFNVPESKIGRGEVYILIDPDNKIPEITKKNNHIELNLNDDKNQKRS